jgi:ATP-dependent Clp protease ATP-binding subunit ClpC
VIFAIPIFVEERPAAEGRPPVFTVRPLFRSEPMQRAEKLSRALNKLSNDLHNTLHELGREPRHDALADWTFHPPLEETTVELRLELASGSYLKRFFFAGYPALDRRLYFTPAWPSLVFEVWPRQTLAERASVVLTRHLRDWEKENGPADPDEFALAGKGRLTTLEITLHPAALATKPKKPNRAEIFGGEEKMDGEKELRKTGRPLHSMYPDDLDRAVGRDREVSELARLLASADRRPILLVGRRQVGKTAILHELVWQIGARKKERFGGRREVWLVSPMRLISGMSFLGEWENRVLAILDYAASKDRVLYFDDLPGLFTAGISSASDLNVAQILRPTLEKRLVRVVAEITPESWRMLRERDRAFADLFHVIPVNEPPEPETLRVLLSVARELEAQHRCAFDIEVVPTALELYRRFGGDAAFPGKAASFLRRLAIRVAGTKAGRPHALYEFRQQSGLHVALLDDRSAMKRAEILNSLKGRLVGQDHALEAFADVILALKARLNDPRRPLGTFLLLGPTGVGKTEAAKTLAEYLFGSSERLLRFDMNEYVDGASVPRLTGTRLEPEGLLTSVIRRRPFSVLLLDEIEKAAPEVFDLLLAVLDEGRLTDSLGRVADFTQCVILLTSNLGVREARSRLGFRAGAEDPAHDDATYVGAAEKFFRPEFFNRLDRVIPFRALRRGDLEGIAHRLIRSVLTREGLKRRECLLLLSEEAMTRLIELGYHPQLGARALKRVVERELAQPMAEQLAATAQAGPAVAAFISRDERFAVEFKELQPVVRSVSWTETLANDPALSPRSTRIRPLIDAAYAALDRIEAQFEAVAPAGRIEVAAVTPEQAWYFSCREQIKKVERLIMAVERAQEGPRKSAPAGRLPRPRPTKLVLRQFISGTPKLDRQLEAIALRADLSELEAEPVEVPDSPVMALARELALLEAMTTQPLDRRGAAMVLRAVHTNDAPEMFDLARYYYNCFEQLWGASVKYLRPQIDSAQAFMKALLNEGPERVQALHLQGFNLRRLLSEAVATILVRRCDGSLGMILTGIHEAASEDEAKALSDQAVGLKERVAFGAFGPVTHLIDANKSITDFRSGIVLSGKPSTEEFRAALISALPLPREVAHALDVARTR